MVFMTGGHRGIRHHHSGNMMMFVSGRRAIIHGISGIR